MAQAEETTYLTDYLNDDECGLAEIYLMMREVEDLGTNLVSICKDRFPNIGFVGNSLASFGPFPRELADSEELRRFHALQHNINERLREYGNCPVLSFELESGKWTESESWVHSYPQRWVALSELLQHAKKGTLSKIRRCVVCNRWYVARTRDQKCCQARCRQKLHASSPDFKAGRRDYMRDLRKKHRARVFTSNHSARNRRPRP